MSPAAVIKPVPLSPRLRQFPGLFVFLLCSFFPAAGGFAKPVQDPVSVNAGAENIDDLIRQLGSDVFEQRLQAEKALAETGVAAIEPLLKAATDSDPEIRTRAIGVIYRLAVSMDTTTQQAAQQAVLQLQSSSDPTIAGIATSRMAGIRQELQSAAMDKLAALGGVVSPQGFQGDFTVTGASSIVIGSEWRGSREDLNVLRWVTGLTEVTLVGPMIDDVLVQEICANNPGIMDLVIRRASITNASIRHIAALKQLSRIQIVFCPINDECFDDLAGLARNLAANNHISAQLQFYGTEITPELCAKIVAETGIEVDRRIGAYLGVYYSQGDGPCIITRVADNSAAKLAGIQEGDRIIEFEGRPIRMADDFRGAVAAFSPGDEVRAVVERDGRSLELKIVLGEFPNDEN
jgi:PDZ domain